MEVRRDGLHDLGPSALNPRKHFDEAKLAELAESIKRHGLLEPLVVREVPPGDPPGAYYEIIAGERRYRAAKLAGLAEVPVRDLGEVDDKTALELALVENLQRQDLDPIEEAEGYRQLNRVVGLTQAAIAAAVNRSQPAVANAMRLLDLPEEVLRRIRAGELTVSHGIALAKWKEWPAIAIALAEYAVDEHLTAKRVEGFDTGSWVLSRAGAIRWHHQANFNWREVCPACPFGAFRGDIAGLHCLKPDHFDQLQAEAEAATQATLDAALRDEVAAGGEDLSGLPRLSTLEQGTYRDLTSYGSPQGCSRDCPCWARALDDYHGRGRVRPICTDPKRHEGLQRAQARDENKAKRDKHRRERETLVAAVDAIAGVGRRELVVLVDHIIAAGGGGRTQALRDAIAHLGLALDADRLTGYHFDQLPKRYRALAQVADRDLVRLGVEVLLRQDLHNKYEGYGSGKLAGWYLAGQTGDAEGDGAEPEAVAP